MATEATGIEGPATLDPRPSEWGLVYVGEFKLGEVGETFWLIVPESLRDKLTHDDGEIVVTARPAA